MRILDTKKTKEQRETEAVNEKERHDYEEWLNNASNTALPTVDTLNDLWVMWDSFTVPHEQLKGLADSLSKRMGTDSVGRTAWKERSSTSKPLGNASWRTPS